MIGSTLNSRFDVLSLLGEGGMASVYEAYDSKRSINVALKFLSPHVAQTKARKDRFLNEYKTLAILNHPNIVSVFELFESDAGEPFFSMELIKGVPLDEKIADIHQSPNCLSQDTTKQLVGYLEQTAQALHYVHSQGIIYCDLKPSNLVLSGPLGSEALGALNVKLIDFGIAKALANQLPDDASAGTALYKSPEHIRGETLDVRADIYSFGVTAYEVLTGVAPFDETSLLKVADSHLVRKVPSAMIRNTELSPGLDKLIRICMKKEKEERYSSMKEVIKRLETEMNSFGKKTISQTLFQPIANFLSS